MNKGKEAFSYTVRGPLTPDRVLVAVRNTPPDISNKGFLTVLRSVAKAGIPAPIARSPLSVAEKADSTTVAIQPPLTTKGTIFRLAPVGLEY